MEGGWESNSTFIAIIFNRSLHCEMCWEIVRKWIWLSGFKDKNEIQLTMKSFNQANASQATVLWLKRMISWFRRLLWFNLGLIFPSCMLSQQLTLRAPGFCRPLIRWEETVGEVFASHLWAHRDETMRWDDDLHADSSSWFTLGLGRLTVTTLHVC